MYQPIHSNAPPSYHHEAAPVAFHLPASKPGLNAANASDSPSTSQYRDLPWAILFLAHLFLITSTGMYFFYSYSQEMVTSSDSPPSSFVSLPIVLLFLAAFAFASLISLAYLSLMRVYPAALIRFTLWVSLAMVVFTFLGSLLSGSMWAIVVSGFFLFLQVWFMYSVQSRVAFSAVILETAVSTIQLFPSTLLIALLGIVAQCVWLTIWLVSSSSIYYALTRNISQQYVNQYGQYDGSDPAINLCLVALVLSFYWTAQVIAYVVHMTIAGVVGVWYFLYPHAVPPAPVAASLRRAVTFSLGSVALGALVLAVIKTLRFILSYVTQKRREEGNESLLLNCAIYAAQCILSVIESVASYLNIYAYCRCAVYGESYCEAGYNSLTMMQARGLDAVVNDSLIGGVLQFGCLICGLTTALLTSAVSYILLSSATLESFSIWGISITAFMLGYSVCGTAVEAVNAAVVGFFVLLADDPEALARTKPEVYERVVTSIAGFYPGLRLDGMDVERGRRGGGRGGYGML